jgi:hypothetical protein
LGQTRSGIFLREGVDRFSHATKFLPVGQISQLRHGNRLIASNSCPALRYHREACLARKPCALLVARAS